MTQLCLNIIVKNEAERIERCLASVAPHIVSWTICDTGSTDGTQAMIRDFFGVRGLPGILAEFPFENFGQARNRALDACRMNPAVWDYMLLVDADMELVAPNGFGDLSAAAYHVMQRSSDLEYWNVRLLRRGAAARYVGVTHEYLSVEGTIEQLPGPYFLDHADGANRPNKAKRDIDLLERAVAANPEDGRSWFYLGQSHKDLGQHASALMAYANHQKCATFEEEQWYGRLAMSRCWRAMGDKRHVHESLVAFNGRSGRLEPLADLARHYRELGMNEVAVMFARRGLGLEQPEDLLFVERDAAVELRQTFAICGYFSKDEATRKEAHDVCNVLALDRNVSCETRELARRNLFWYAQPAAELMPSFAPRPIPVDPPAGYRAMNPSVALDGDHIAAVIRCVNYEIDEGGYYRYPADDPVIRTRNFLVNLSDDLGLTIARGEIRQPSGPILYGEIIGFEDMRLFRWRSRLWALATCLQHDAQARAQQFLVDLGVNAYGEIPLTPDSPSSREKNWMPFVDEGRLRFIYRCDPTRIVDERGATLSEESKLTFAADNFSGGSQLIPFLGGWLALVHEAIASPIDGKRCYQHRFVWFDEKLTPTRVSRRFFFNANNQIEFAAGLCWHPDGRCLVVSYGIKDREAWLATIEADEVRSLVGINTEMAMPKRAHQSRRPWESADAAWVIGQTNRALIDKSAIDHARHELGVLDLPRHPDYPKSWDSYLALWHAYHSTDPRGLVIDAGGTRDSVFLSGLARLGFTNLMNFNIDERKPETIGAISYAEVDITQTGLGDRKAEFVACLSVLEHGVDWRAFLAETARILAPGGHLFVSVDYWETPIDCRGQMAFGEPVQIFNNDEIRLMVYEAHRLGLSLDGDMDARCGERVVNWLGLDFTFLNLLFRRE
jgi:glycosyltransferase involved in cell wall biosynthesis